MTYSTTESAWLTQLEGSRARVLELAQALRIDAAELRCVAETEASIADLLQPVPLDPAAHVRAAHRRARPYLQRLLQHDPAVEVRANDQGYTYTPRKILRRVHDHALDHLSQVEQWLAWQQHGIVPTPTDGWAESTVTLEEDRLPLSAPDLAAWLWRIDLTIELLSQRASQLSLAQLDWVSPNGDWTLRQVLYHVAAAEIFYAATLDEALPEDSIARFTEASARFRKCLQAIMTVSWGEEMALIDGSDVMGVVEIEQIVQRVLEAEQSLMDEVANGASV